MNIGRWQRPNCAEEVVRVALVLEAQSIGEQQPQRLPALHCCRTAHLGDPLLGRVVGGQDQNGGEFTVVSLEAATRPVVVVGGELLPVVAR